MSPHDCLLCIHKTSLRKDRTLKRIVNRYMEPKTREKHVSSLDRLSYKPQQLWRHLPKEQGKPKEENAIEFNGLQKTSVRAKTVAASSMIQGEEKKASATSPKFG